MIVSVVVEGLSIPTLIACAVVYLLSFGTGRTR